jgi:hypothetical protein
VALNFADSIACRVNVVDRVKGSVIRYANYLLSGSPTASQKAWALDALRVPGEWAERLSWFVVANANFIASGSAIPDTDIDYIVQNTTNTQFIAS